MEETPIQAVPTPKEVPSQPAQLIAWLEEARRRDRAELQRVQTLLEQLAGHYRENLGRLEVVEGELRQLRSHASRVSHVEGGLLQLREVQASTQEWLEEHDRSSTRGSQAQAIDAERERRKVAELQTQISEVLREAESLKARQTLLSEELRRDQNNLPPVLQQIEETGKRLQGLVNRLDLVDETQRHRDVRVTDLSQNLERLGADQARFTDWQRLSEVRWTRQLSDWQQQMEEWRQLSEDGVREVTGVAKNLPAIRDELAELRRAISDERDRGNERAAMTAELSAQRGVDREALAMAEQRVGGVAGRLDALSAQFNVVVDRVDRMVGEQQSLDGRMRGERERIESILIALARMEERDTGLERHLEEVIKDLAKQGREQQARGDELERNVADLARRTDLRVGELERLDEQHKQREIVELEQQIREMQERARQAKS